MLMQATAPGAAAATEAKTGVTFFPPNTCDPHIVAPPRAPSANMQLMAAAGVLPSYFCWADNANVAAVKKWGKRPKDMGAYTSPVFNQHTCGSCWAVASAGVFSDRWSIFTQDVNPNFSVTHILSCVRPGSPYEFPNCNGCNGGLPAGAAAFFAKSGDVTSQIAPYSWCDQNSVCKGQEASVGSGGDYLNSRIPACRDKPGNMMATKKAKAKYYTSAATAPLVMQLANPQAPPPPPTMPGSFTARSIDVNTSAALSITGVSDIQAEILANGPVVGAMAVFYDFQAGSINANDCWAPTKGVYCNVQHGPSPYANTTYAGFAQQNVGYHAVAVIGWGVEKDVPDWTQPGKTFDLPYWIVRNSWGTEWNPQCTVNGGKVRLPGHFKIAWTDKQRSINTQVLLDQTNGYLGGCTAFEPDVVRKRGPDDRAPQPQPQPEKSKKFMFDGTACVPAADNATGPNVYDSFQQCTTAHNLSPLTFDCDVLRGKCIARDDGSGKYATADACTSECAQQHRTAMALIITFSVLAAAGIAIGVGVGVSKRKGKLRGGWAF
jgi:hypothetical protein